MLATLSIAALPVWLGAGIGSGDTSKPPPYGSAPPAQLRRVPHCGRLIPPRRGARVPLVNLMILPDRWLGLLPWKWTLFLSSD